MHRRPDRHPHRVQPRMRQQRMGVRIPPGDPVAVRRPAPAAPHSDPPPPRSSPASATIAAAASPPHGCRSRSTRSGSRPRRRVQRRAQEIPAMPEIRILVVCRRLPLRERHGERVVPPPERLQRHRPRIADRDAAPGRSAASRYGRCRDSRDGSRWPGSAADAAPPGGSPPPGRSPPCSCGTCPASRRRPRCRPARASSRGLAPGVAEIRFEPVQRLDREPHPMLPSVFACGLQPVHHAPHPVVLLLLAERAGRAAGEDQAACRRAGRRRARRRTRRRRRRVRRR